MRIRDAEEDAARQAEQAALPVDVTGIEALDEYEDPGDGAVGSFPPPANQKMITRTEYKPPDPNWEVKEKALLEQLKELNDEVEENLEEEPPGVDELLVVEVGSFVDRFLTLSSQGFQVPDVADQKIKDAIDVEVATHVKRGYDIVRIGNVRGITEASA